jgi:hypothetical protein
MLTDGQKKCGVDMTNEIDWFSHAHIRRKEIKCVEIIKQHLTNIQEVSIIGTRYPVNYVTELHKEYNCKFNLIDFHPFFEEWCLEGLSFADINIYRMRPLFDDINPIINKSDLIIFPETEYLLPFEYLNYDLKDKNVMFVNEDLEPNDIKNNFVYSLDDMEEMCNVKSNIKDKIVMPTNIMTNTFFFLLKLA